MLRYEYIEALSASVLPRICAEADWIGYESGVAQMARATALVLEASEFLRTEDPHLGRVVGGLLDRLLRSHSDEPRRTLNQQESLLLTVLRHVQALLAQPRPHEQQPVAWRATVVSEDCWGVPAMLTAETMQFYSWLGSRVSSCARIVELGAWLGASTRCLCDGIGRSADARIDVYDSFVWAHWMDEFVSDEPHRDWPRTGESFLPMFHETVRDYAHQIITHPGWIDDGLTPGGRPEWGSGEPIELLIYDMGPDRPVLDAVWETFSPFFMRNSTVVVFNEYAKMHSSQLWDFCDVHADCLRPHHKPYGSAKGFLYV